ncbi:MAG: hypothetical protein SAK29_32950, partial [Scytonema sp. PMC 1069.18]|nr:hypothetical protein [Scytonema sp. PMC 1069.18]
YYQLGNKEKLVKRFLKDAIKDCGLQNERAALLVLYLLTEENGTRPLKTKAELVTDLETADFLSEVEKLDLVLEILVGSGLILNIPDNPADRYQLVHDYLVSFIRQSQQAGELQERKKEKEKQRQAEVELNRILQQQRNTAKRQRNIAIAFFSIMTILALLTGGFWKQAEYQRKEAVKQQILAISKGSEALFGSNQRFEALVESMRAAKQLKKVGLEKTDSQLRSQVITALQQPVYWLLERNRLEQHQGLIWGVDFSIKRNMIASASFDHTVGIWKRDGSLLQQLEGHKDKVLGVSFSHDGNMVASSDFEGKVKLWKWNDKLGKFLDYKTLEKSQNDISAVYAVAFSPDSQVFASASRNRDGTIHIWKQDAWNREFKLEQTIKAHKDGANSVAFSPDGQIMATGGRDNTVKLWKLNTQGQFEFYKSLRAFQDYVWTVAWSPDGEKIAIASRDKTVKLWEWKSDKQPTMFCDSFDCKLKPESHSDRVMSVSFSPDGNVIASASLDKKVKLWNQEGTLLATISGHSNGVYDVNFVSDTTLISGSADLTLRFWQFKNNSFSIKGSHSQPQGVLKILNSHRNRVNKVSFSNNETRIATASDDKTVKIWKPNGILEKTLTGHTEKVNSLAFSPDGKMLVTTGDDKTVKLWQQDGILLQTLTGFKDRILDISFSPDGNTLALGGRDNSVTLLRRYNNSRFETRPYQVLTGHRDWVRAVAWSPDGEMIASASDDNTIKLWKSDGQGGFKIHETLTKNGHKSWVYSVSFSPDGSMLATSSNDKTAILWKRDGQGEFKFYRKLKEHTDQVKSVSFSPDGKMVATGGDDKTVRLWKTDDGSLYKTLIGHTETINSVSFSPDGKTLALASSDKTIIIWNLEQLNKFNNLDNLLEYGCNWLSDYFKTNSSISDGDRRLCDDINTQIRD